MKLFHKSHDEGSDSGVTGFWLIESKKSFQYRVSPVLLWLQRCLPLTRIQCTHVVVKGFGDRVF